MTTTIFGFLSTGSSVTTGEGWYSLTHKDMKTRRGE